MNNQILIFILTFTVICVLVIFFNIDKKAKGISLITSLFANFLFVCVYSLISSCISFDNCGNVYFFESEPWKYNKYYSEDGKEFYIECGKSDSNDKSNCYFVNLNNENESYSINSVYLDRTGFVVIDKLNEYHSIMNLSEIIYNPYKGDEEGVYINQDKRRVYDITMCEVDIFGRFIYPESLGFYFGNHYFKFYYSSKYNDERNLFIDVIGKVEITFVFISIIWFCFSILKHKGLLNDNKKLICYLYRPLKYFFTFVALFFYMEFIKSNYGTIIEFFIRIVIGLSLTYLQATYILGFTKMLPNILNDEALVLNDLKGISDAKEVIRLRIQSVFILFCYIIIWFIYCMIRSLHIYY